MKKIINIFILLFSCLIYSQGSSNISNAVNSPASVPNPSVLIGANPIPSGTWKVYLKDDIRWETYNINGFNTQVINVTGMLYKPLSYTPSSSEISTALGYTPLHTETDPIWSAVASTYRTKSQNDLLYQPVGVYLTSESDPVWSGVSSNYRTKTQNDLLYQPIGIYLTTESDPIWTGVAGNYRTKVQNDLLYQPVGSYLTTETDPTVSTYAKSLTGFSVIKTDTDLVYEPLFTKNTAFNKDFGSTSGTVTEGSDMRLVQAEWAYSWGDHAGLYPLLSGSYNDPSWVASLDYNKIINAPTYTTVAITGSYNDLIDKPSIPAGQVQTDWNAVSGLGVLLNKPSLSTVATSGVYNDLTGKPTIPTDNSQLANGNNYITASSTNTLTNKSGNISQWTNNSGYLTSFTETDPLVPTYSKSLNAFSVIKASTDPLYKAIGYTPTSLEITTALGFTPITNARTITINGVTLDLSANRTWTVGDLLSTGSYANPSWITSLAYGKLTGTPTIPSNTSQISESSNLYYTDTRARTAISLTTTGSGVASYNSSTGALNIPTNTGTVSSIIAGTGLSGGTITTTGTISMPNIGTPGTYNTVVTDAQGRVTTGYSATPASVTRNITGTSFQVSTLQASRVKYTITHTVALTLLLSSGSSMAYLEISPNNSTWTLVDQAGFSRALTVAVALNDSMTNNISAEVPVGYYVRVRTVTSGGGSATYTCGQETIY